MLIGLDLDGVLCDLVPAVSSRIEERFGVTTHPASWQSYDLRLLRLGLPEEGFHAFLEETFSDPLLYRDAPVAEGAAWGLGQLLSTGWRAVGITARPGPLASVTKQWLRSHGLRLAAVHHTAVGTKATVARRLAVDVTVEDNPEEAELLGEVCQSWLIDRPYNRNFPLTRSRRLSSWAELVAHLCPHRARAGGRAMGAATSRAR